jgi:curved DNA-binding protein CbpA
VSKTFYQLLDVQPSASLGEIKRAFRREIARYHPDKVQHLGQEFQEIAATRAAELTQAYKTLSDDALRAEYDALLQSGGEPATVMHASPAAPPNDSQTAAAPRPEPASDRHPAPEPPPSGGSSVFSEDRAGANDLVRRATVMRFHQALKAEFGSYEQTAVQGFEIACIPHPKPSFWSKSFPPRILGRFVPRVDAASLVETWTLASRMKKDNQRDLCVFLMGPAMAAAGELASAIAGQRKKPMPAGGKVIMIPVSTRNWNAHIPTDAPPVVKSLLTRLKSL